MKGSSRNGAVVAGVRARGRVVALVALVGAVLLLGQVRAGAAEGGSRQVAGPAKESPYARYAREHARAAEKLPIRVRPASSTVHGARGGARVAHH